MINSNHLRRPREPLVSVERPVDGPGDDDDAPPDRLEEQPADDEAAHGALRGERRDGNLGDERPVVLRSGIAF